MSLKGGIKLFVQTNDDNLLHIIFRDWNLINYKGKSITRDPQFIKYHQLYQLMKDLGQTDGESDFKSKILAKIKETNYDNETPIDILV